MGRVSKIKIICGREERVGVAATPLGIKSWTRSSRRSEFLEFSEGLRLQRGFNLEAPLLKKGFGNELRVLVATRPLTKTS